MNGGVIAAVLGFQLPIMLGLPLLIGWWIKRHYGVGWGAFGWGALTFILSQVIHLPLNFALGLLGGGRGVALWPLVPMALVAGLSAGVCEEGARWLMLRFVARKVRGWPAGLQFGAGHGGVESIILGVLALLGLINIIASSAVDPTTLGLPQATLEQLQAAQTQYWSTPVWTFLVGGLERVFAITAHIAMASLVMRAVVRSRPIYLAAAIAMHTLLDFWAVLGMRKVGVLGVEGGVAVFALFSLWVIWRLREEPAVPVAREPFGPAVPPTAAQTQPQELSEAELARRVDSSKYE